MSDAQLERLAAEAGLMIDWQDANKRPQRVSAEVQRGLLEALGYPAQSPQQIQQSLNALAQRRAQVPPLLTADCGRPVSQVRGRPRRHPGRAGLRGRHADRTAKAMSTSMGRFQPSNTSATTRCTWARMN